MTDRQLLCDTFLAGAGWAAASRAPLAGDASNRRYERLSLDTHRAVLMDARPDSGEDVRPFARIARYLAVQGLSAPRIVAEDADHGFLLLEDLGDALFAHVVADDPSLESPLYEAATDVLVHLHAADPPADLPPYSPALMTRMSALAWQWYAAGADRPAPEAEAAFTAAFQPMLEQDAADASVLIQRDYHAENLLWLPDRTGVARVGLLDFQDALRGHPAYDLVSVLQDARRDVPPAIERAMIARYCTATGRNRDTFARAYHLLGAQRNLRIVGVFARLCMTAGKSRYIDLIPRVWTLLERDLAHPALAPVRAMITDSLPPPTPDTLQRLKSRCAIAPTP
ncbi:MAG: aminoglycoside phosphotransferase [Sediminimonas qiaohouensis]|uniref:Aminoglycoside phosphotransferase n=1 Tax=Sediminimonas qiaohouensis TaxID=552061 RepID=A0A7C9HAV2_9RHOB|nr:phosphotransferase [Sediminimonas qiaohouensis]MTJ04631.1 aminoglycoside phosphotransferase [Sediminimonas qiaohouensis]